MSESNTPKAKLITFKAKDQLIKEGARDRLLYVLRSGSVRVYKTYLGRKLTLATLGKGEVFGELSFFDGKPRIANVEAIESGEALVIDGEVAQSDLETLPTWMPGVFRTIISRLRETDNKLTLLKNKYDLGSASKDNDLIVREVLTETLRIAKIFKLYFESSSKISGGDLDQKINEFQILFGNTFLKVEKILFTFKNEGYLIEDNSESLSISSEKIGTLIDYLEEKLGKNEIWLLSKTSLRFLEELLHHVNETNKAFNDETLVSDLFDKSAIQKFNDYEDFHREIKSMNLIAGEKIKIRVADIEQHVKYQSLMASYNVRVD